MKINIGSRLILLTLLLSVNAFAGNECRTTMLSCANNAVNLNTRFTTPDTRVSEAACFQIVKDVQVACKYDSIVYASWIVDDEVQSYRILPELPKSPIQAVMAIIQFLLED